MGKDKPGGINVAVHVLIDASGSMGDYTKTTIKAANEYISQLASASSPPTVTMTAFSNVAYDMIDNKPVYELPQVTDQTYQVGGGTNMMTPLANAIKRLETTPARRKAIVILTDGEDGSGIHPDKIRKLVEQKVGEGYLFLFLGANQSAEAVAKVLGIPVNCAITYKMKNIDKVMAKAAELTLRFGDGDKAVFTSEDKKGM